MKFVKAIFVLHQQGDQDKGGNPNGQAKDVEGGKKLLPFEISKKYGQIMMDHDAACC